LNRYWSHSYSFKVSFKRQTTWCND